MRTARTTVLMTPEEKAALERRAARLGVSSGESIRLTVDNYEKVTPEEEAELAVLVAEANIVIPRMAGMLDNMSRKLREAHDDVDRILREAGVRK